MREIVLIALIGDDLWHKCLRIRGVTFPSLSVLDLLPPSQQLLPLP